jgi:hypothetical protein
VITAALVTVAAAAVSVDGQGGRQVAALIQQLEKSWQGVRVGQVHGEMDYSVCCTGEKAVAAARNSHNAAKGGHV